MPPHGQPNLNERFVSFPNDPRTRIIKPAQAGPTCFIDALYWMIPRIGEHPASQGMKGRAIEILTERLKRDLTNDLSIDLRCRIFEQFLDKVGLDYKSRFVDFIPWEKLSDEKKLPFLNIQTQKFVAQDNGLKLSKWKPSQPFQSLIDELRNNGPLYVGGWLGSTYYNVLPSPKPTASIDGIIPFGWTSKDAIPLKQMNTTGHKIVICGAQLTADGREFVYFKDPNYPSVPLHLRNPGVTYYDLFVMRYDTLKKGVSTTNGITPLAPVLFKQDNDTYAWYSEELARYGRD